MPTSYIKELHKEGHGSIAALEKKWDEAKAIAVKEGKADNFAYVTSIFKRLVGVKATFFTKTEASGAFFQHLAAKYKISLPEAQQRWQFAKDRASKEGHPNNVPYILQILEDMRGEKDRVVDRMQKKQDQQKTLQDKSDLYRPAAPSQREQRESREMKEAPKNEPQGEKAKLVAPIFTFNAVLSALGAENLQRNDPVTTDARKGDPRFATEGWRNDPKKSAHRTEFVRRATLRTKSK